ncbi:cinnamoyl-CoA reductase-like SNL6 [Cornus florida]|uniref:cinnamoyl-CoA reductase-like SNL6 n=1 Tax=Cornus florida TaxID=4283 RepID=UPI0028A1FE6F|nr:cinnamoyl-CoA reductase-like SNL6 [Cornus florida]
MECYREEVVVSIPLETPTLGDEQRKCNGNVFSCSLSARERKLVCVTSGNSYFGSHLVRKLLAHGYLVRVTIQNQVDIEDMKELIREEEMNKLESVVVAKMGDLESLCDAFRGCHAIFHTSSFVDPHGISGYTEQMAFLETEGAKNVIEACGIVAYVKRCIFTSSLLASIWKRDNADRVVDEGCWSDEEFCRENKFWLALGKTTAEKVAWRKARELKVKLVTVCPGLLMAPSFPNAHFESSLPYLKGGQVMLQRGILATEDVDRMAEVHVHVYEAMDHGACGRYLCFNRVVRRSDEAIQLENVLKMHGLLSAGLRNVVLAEDTDEIPNRLSSSRLARLVFRASQRLFCEQC